MKKLLFLFSLAISLVLLVASCSSDDDAKSNCESCTSGDGTFYELCENADGTYTAKQDGEATAIITEGELEGFTPKEVIELTCELDGGEITF